MKDQDQLKAIQQENQLLKQLGTTVGFYQYYFKQLKNYNTNKECYNAVNDLYFNLYGEYRYSSWGSFCHSKIYKNQQ